MRRWRSGFLVAFSLAPAWTGPTAGERMQDRRAFLSPDGSVAAVLPSASALRFVRTADGSTLSEAVLPSPGTEFAFSPDGRRAAAALFQGGVLAAETAGGSPLLLQEGQACSDLSWSADGRRLSFVARSVPPSPLVEGALELKVWDAQARRILSTHRITAERAPAAAAPSAPRARASPGPEPAEPPPPPRPRNEARSGERGRGGRP